MKIKKKIKFIIPFQIINKIKKSFILLKTKCKFDLIGVVIYIDSQLNIFLRNCLLIKNKQKRNIVKIIQIVSKF
jgi:small nuclear ribonucleoprotein (snRNP)-like protein